MSWIPAFAIGLYNAWILMLFVVLHPLIMRGVDRAFGTGNLNQKMGESPGDEPARKQLPLPTLLLIILFVYSIFLPLSHDGWLIAGLSLYLVGIVIFLSSLITASKTPLGQVFSTGMYRYSRHPLYLSFGFIFLGISVATVSWLFLFLSMGWMVFPLSQVNAEEQGCLEAFGNAYHEYTRKTPKWLGLPKP